MNEISIIICCYNSAQVVPKTLEHIAKQKIPADTSWEVVLVNNNSSDDTEEVAMQIWEQNGRPTRLKIVREPEPGLSHAREKGMEEASFELILWCDDDNWLCDSYVANAIETMNANSGIGALGGWCEAAFEKKKPDWFDSYSRFFAVSKQGKRSGDITDKKGCVYGAGMVLRKSHWKQLKEAGFKHLLKDRKGESLSSGGDTEYCYALRLLGYKIWYDDRLFFKHLMTTGRLSLDYVSRIRKAMAYSNFILWPYLDILRKKPRTRNDFIKGAFKGFPLVTVKKCVALFIGRFEQREDAKRYFRNANYQLFWFNVYKRNTTFLKSWINES